MQQLSPNATQAMCECHQKRHPGYLINRSSQARRQKKKEGNLCRYKRGNCAQSFSTVVREEAGESCFPFRELAPLMFSMAQLGSRAFFGEVALGNVGVRFGVGVSVGWEVVEFDG
jgi:hypothetical protein